MERWNSIWVANKFNILWQKKDKRVECLEEVKNILEK
jgi:hypothetical protein